MENKIVFTSQVTKSDFLKANLVVTYRSGIIKFFLALAFLAALLMIYTIFSGNFQGENVSTGLMIQAAFILYAILGIPLSVYFRSSKIFKSNPRLGEKRIIDLSHSEMKIKAESYETGLTIDKFYKIKELTNTFLFYDSKASAIFIPKKGLSESEISFMREIKRNFKKNMV